MFGWFSSKKKEVEEVKEETRKSFEVVKKDIDHVGKWIKHLHEKDSRHSELISDHHMKIGEVDSRVASMEQEIEQLKEHIASMQEDPSHEVFRQASTAVYKQRAVLPVDKAVQTTVQAGVEQRFLKSSIPFALLQLTSMERAVVYVLLHSDLKLSYEDLAVMLGKDRSTLRSQLNTIKQKCEGLIEEVVEKSGKKRVWIPEELKGKLIKSAKLRGFKRISSLFPEDEKDEVSGVSNES